MEANSIEYGNPTWQQYSLTTTESYLDELYAELHSDIMHFPPNDSKDVKQEINTLIDNVKKLRDSADFNDKKILYQAYDNNLIGYIKQYMYDMNADETEVTLKIDNIVKDINPLIFKLKYAFNRPRPYQLARHYKLKFFPYGSFTSNSPSYPSVKAVQAKVICVVLGNVYPKAFKVLQDLADDVATSRIMLGHNYQSDIDYSLVVAKKIYTNKAFNLHHKN